MDLFKRYKILKFEVNLTPFEHVDLARTGLKSFVLFLGKKNVEIENIIYKIFFNPDFSKLKFQILKPKISKYRILRTKIFKKPLNCTAIDLSSMGQ